MNGLLPQHQQLIDKSAIAPDVARARGYCSVEEAGVLREWTLAHYQRRVPGMIIPRWTTGGIVAGCQYRPDEPRADERGRSIKYESPPGQRYMLDVNPAIRHLLAVPSIPLWWTEGARKADAAISHGLPCISLAGVFGWRGTNWFGGKQTLHDFDDIALNGRRNVIAFDSDLLHKSEVRNGMIRLAAVLRRRGADVFIARISADRNAEKVGLDDFIAGGGNLRALNEQAVPADEYRGPVSPAGIHSIHATSYGYGVNEKNPLAVVLPSGARFHGGARRVR